MVCLCSVRVRRQLEVFRSLLLPCGSLGANSGYRLSGKRLYLMNHLASPMIYFIDEYNKCSVCLNVYASKCLANRKHLAKGLRKWGPCAQAFCCCYTIWHQARSFPITSGFCFSHAEAVHEGSYHFKVAHILHLGPGTKQQNTAQQNRGPASSTSQGLLPPPGPQLPVSWESPPTTSPLDSSQVT